MVPISAPVRHVSVKKSETDCRTRAQSNSLLGSNTTHWVPYSIDASMYWKRRRILMYFQSALLETVRAVYRGESRLTPQVARKVMDQFRRLASLSEATLAGTPVNGPAASSKPSGAAQAKATDSVAETLSDKEEKILSLIAEGKSNKQIAAAVFLAEGTVKNYVSRIMEKLHANTRTELAVMSVRQRRGD